ncbi:DEKNAAC101739 [Brettanomyces naardenensis]|uniref:tRNA ligase n=1 Tax=Brettanomyces naardenensis TaxID=13370 RepID=A0A448YIT5_BRENA|nr:DEKNAAC101739 [Brettanomyces naardenensis]
MVVNLPFEPVVVSNEEREKDIDESIKLISELEELAKVHPKKGAVRKFTNSIDGTSIPVNSWKFNEWDYSSKKLTLPTYARGLFTIDNRIVCRGYDKFYNVNEFNEVSEEVLSKSTTGPYTLTVKSNGCIVFISGLKDGTLVVCSKHSTGVRDDVQKNHAMAAQQALELQLDRCHMTKLDLAETLYKLGLTAVAEYCDDNFEEHVLEYKDDRAGLYLHGLNFNSPKFRTYPMEEVNSFGSVFGFKRTKFRRFDTFREAMIFLSKAAATGSFEGEEVEGFVVRCYKTGTHNDFFFKFKFEEPYLLYRELREVTKQFIQGGPQNVHFGKHKLICMDYLKYIMPFLHDNEKLRQSYLDNKGIVELRKKYFDARGQTGLEVIDEEVSMAKLEDEMRLLKFGSSQTCKYAIVTVATIGCGKTTTSLALANLYPDLVGHIQNDNISRPVGSKLVSGALEILVNKPMVILDKNNHKYVERQKIFDDFAQLNEIIPSSKLKFICLNFLPMPPKGDTELWKVTRDRIIERGDNHQSIKAGGSGIGKAEKIMQGFINRFQPVKPRKEPDSKFDLIINLNAKSDNSTFENIKTVVESLVSFASDLDIPRPTEEQYQEAFRKALDYKPSINKIVHSRVGPRTPVYFGTSILDPQSLQERIEDLVGGSSELYEKLKATGRIMSEFHVTMIHYKSKKKSQEIKALWNRYVKSEFAEDLLKIDEQSSKITGQRILLPSKSKADIKLEKFCCNSKVACIKVSVDRIYRADGTDISLGLGNKFPHITIGTINEEIRPAESNNLLNEIYEFNATDGIQCLDFKDSEENSLKGLPIFAHY